MKLPDRAVRRPVTTAMIFLAIFLFGIIAMQRLPLDIMPELELPALTVITVYPGASAEEVEQQVTKPIEAMLSGTENLDNIKSQSKENVSIISLEFKWGSEITEAANNARDLLDMVRQKLPDDARRPILYKLNSSMLPVMLYGVTADNSYNGLEKIIEDKVASPIRKVEGVGTVIYLGQPTREINVNIDPMKLSAYNLNMEALSKILELENISIPGGNIKIGGHDYALRVPGDIKSVEEIRNIALINFNNKIIRLRDVADVKDTYKEKDVKARTDRGEGMVIMVQKQSGVNTLEVVDNLRKKMAKSILPTLPPDIRVNEILSGDEVIVQSIGGLSDTLWYALIFVVLIVLMFLREWKSSFIVLLTIPVSLIAAFITMYIMGWSINIFSLMSLIIAIGMVVDDTIVVLENITHHIENGAKPKMAAIFGTSEMGMAIMASTITTLVVFVPMVFLGGVVGIMFKQLAVLIAITMAASLFTALSLTPMAASQLLKPASAKRKKHSWIFRVTERQLQRVDNRYKIFLDWVLRHKTVTLVSALIILIVSVWSVKFISSDYIPNFDAGDVAIVIETEVGTSTVKTDEAAQKVMQIIKEEVPEMVDGTLGEIAGQTEEGLLATVGFSEGKNVATILCHLTLPNTRNRTAEQIGIALRKRISEIPEIERYHVTAGNILSAALLGNKQPVEVEITGNSFTSLNQAASQIENSIKNIPGLADVTSTVDKGKMEIDIEIDRAKASSLGLNAGMIGLQVRQGIYGTEAGNYSESGEDYKIIIRYSKENRNSVGDVENIMLTNLRGETLPLKSVAKVTMVQGPMLIDHESQERIVKVKSSLAPGMALGEAAKEVQQKIDELQLPEDVDVVLGGQVTDQGSSFSDLAVILIIGILLVYMVMAAQFESFLDPFIIMSAVPLAMVGIILTFHVTRLTLSVTTFIGAIMLVGIVVKNGIVFVDYINLLRKRGNSLYDAVKEAGRSRLRPILMTNFTTIFGMIPMALSTKMGREMFSPLAVTMIGGLLVSMLITLFVVPALYGAMHQGAQKIKELKKEQ